MYTGCTATRGQSDVVLCMTICATSQASTIPLSVYINIPVHPALSLHLAASATFSMYISWLTFMDCGAVEKILISVSALLRGLARLSEVSNCIEVLPPCGCIRCLVLNYWLVGLLAAHSCPCIFLAGQMSAVSRKDGANQLTP